MRDDICDCDTYPVEILTSYPAKCGKCRKYLRPQCTYAPRESYWTWTGGDINDRANWKFGRTPHDP
jgi:hypothetical protein